MATNDYPWSKFFWDDWFSDHALFSCSLAAQGLWMRLLCVMYRSDRRGYLQRAGKPLTLEQIAKYAGCSTAEARTLLQELVDSGAAYCTPEGVLYNRRMVRDEDIRTKRSKAGKASAGARASPNGLFEQKPQQKLSNAIGAPLASENLKAKDFQKENRETVSQAKADFELTPEGQAQRFCYRQKPKRDDPYAVAEHVREAYRLGLVDPKELMAEIDRDQRPKNECWWQLSARFIEKRGTNATGRPVRSSVGKVRGGGSEYANVFDHGLKNGTDAKADK